jgi:hypothetical protein
MLTSVPASSCAVITSAPMRAPLSSEVMALVPLAPLRPPPATISMLSGSMCHSPPRPTTGTLTTSSERCPEVST